MAATVDLNKLGEVARRIREMREICGFTVEQMAEKTEVSAEEYMAYEAGKLDFPFSFIHKCALAFGIGITDLLEGRSAHLSSYTVTRKGEGQETAKEDGIDIANLAPKFKDKLAEPYWVKYEYSAEQQNKPIHLTTHSGQEFDLVLSGSLKVQIGNHTEILHEGDIVKVDVGACLKGYHGDAARTFFCGNVSEEAKRLEKEKKIARDKAKREAKEKGE